jgi:hypothetical protein
LGGNPDQGPHPKSGRRHPGPSPKTRLTPASSGGARLSSHRASWEGRLPSPVGRPAASGSQARFSDAPPKSDLTPKGTKAVPWDILLWRDHGPRSPWQELQGSWPIAVNSSGARLSSHRASRKGAFPRKAEGPRASFSNARILEVPLKIALPQDAECHHPLIP